MKWKAYRIQSVTVCLCSFLTSLHSINRYIEYRLRERKNPLMHGKREKGRKRSPHNFPKYAFAMAHALYERWWKLSWYHDDHITTCILRHRLMPLMLNNAWNARHLFKRCAWHLRTFYHWAEMKNRNFHLSSLVYQLHAPFHRRTHSIWIFHFVFGMTKITMQFIFDTKYLLLLFGVWCNFSLEINIFFIAESMWIFFSIIPYR